MKLEEARPSDPLNIDSRSLFVVWKNPDTGRYYPVARLDLLASGEYVFSYRPEASKLDGFFPLEEFPNFEKIYRSESLPVFFLNRIMSPRRPSYDDYLTWLGVEGVSSVLLPMEVLARTGGGRATDTFYVVDYPDVPEREFQTTFFISGISHSNQAEKALSLIEEGSELKLKPEPDNPYNPKAQVIDTLTGEQLGWVPDWLCDPITTLASDGWSIDLRVLKYNADAPSRSKVLVSLLAKRP